LLDIEQLLSYFCRVSQGIDNETGARAAGMMSPAMVASDELGTKNSHCLPEARVPHF
jgi:hypothetical protein